MSCVSLVIPLFNRDPNVVEKVIDAAFDSAADEIVLVNTGANRLGLKRPNLIEVFQPLPQWLPGITRNIGAVVANCRVQVHTGADIVLLSGSWASYANAQDNEILTAPCALLSPTQTTAFLRGERKFARLSYHRTSGAALGLTKQTALMVFKGPFDWEMRGWGWVDVDVCRRAGRLGVKRRIIDVKIGHLYHQGGSGNWNASAKDKSFTRNLALMGAKRKGRGWWSTELEPKQKGRRAMSETIFVYSHKRGFGGEKPNSYDECQICAALDYVTEAEAVEILKSAREIIKEGGRIRVTFNDMAKLGPAWAKSPVNRYGRLEGERKQRITFWSASSMADALSEAGFDNVLASTQHVGGPHSSGVTTLVGTKPYVPKEEAPAKKAKATTKRRKRGRPKKTQ